MPFTVLLRITLQHANANATFVMPRSDMDRPMGFQLLTTGILQCKRAMRAMICLLQVTNTRRATRRATLWRASLSGIV